MALYQTLLCPRIMLKPRGIPGNLIKLTKEPARPGEFIPTFEFQIAREIRTNLSDTSYQFHVPIVPKLSAGIRFTRRGAGSFVRSSCTKDARVTQFPSLIVSGLMSRVFRSSGRRKRWPKWPIYDGSSSYQISKRHFHQPCGE